MENDPSRASGCTVVKLSQARRKASGAAARLLNYPMHAGKHLERLHGCKISHARRKASGAAARLLNYPMHAGKHKERCVLYQIGSTVRKFKWYRYCLQQLYVTKFSTISFYLTKLYVTYSEIRQNFSNSVLKIKCYTWIVFSFPSRTVHSFASWEGWNLPQNFMI